MIAALLWLAAASASHPISTTIAEVRLHPKEFAGKRLRLEGWINSCRSIECLISEHLAARPVNYGQSLSLGANDALDQVLRPMLPARVEIEAEPGPCLGQACLDRAPDLVKVKVLKVISRNQKFSDE